MPPIEGIPEGYDLVRVGYPANGDLVLVGEGQVHLWAGDANYERYPVAILTRLAAWRRIGDASVPTLPYLKARFKTYEDDPWTYAHLVEYRPGPMRFKASNQKWYRFCEIQIGD